MENRTSIEHSIYLISKVKLLTTITVNHLNIANNGSSNKVHREFYLRFCSFTILILFNTKKEEKITLE